MGYLDRRLTDIGKKKKRRNNVTTKVWKKACKIAKQRQMRTNPTGNSLLFQPHRVKIVPSVNFLPNREETGEPVSQKRSV